MSDRRRSSGPFSSEPSAAGTTADRPPRLRPATSHGSGARRSSPTSTRSSSSTSRRPVRWSRSRSGRTRKIEWPENTFYRARIPGANRDAILLVGVEPNYRWRTFSEIVTDLARDLGVELAVTLGALVADVPHTRPSPVTGAATDPQLVDELGLQLSRYEGPTGIVGVLLDSCRRVGIPSVSLWAAVPHYVQLAPSPPAAKALCERLAGVLATDIDVSELTEASEEYVEQVSQAVATDTETAGYVEELERRTDSLGWLEESDDLVSGDALAAEITRFLREREADDDVPESGGPG